MREPTGSAMKEPTSVRGSDFTLSPLMAERAFEAGVDRADYYKLSHAYSFNQSCSGQPWGLKSTGRR